MSKISMDEQVANIIKGLETTLTELQPKLNDQVDGLSTKQLRRALKATINYVTTKQDGVDASALAESEKEFLGGMFAAVESGVQYSLHVISELQRSQLEKQNAEETAKEGESNE